MDTRRHLTAAIAWVGFAIATPVTAATPAGAMAPIANPGADHSGPAAIAAANRQARAASQPGNFQDGLQVFDYAPGRIYEVWTSPLRVTTLSLGAGETVLNLAAGDTLRWQIAEAASGEGTALRVHVLIKPLARGLETNLVLATSSRVYLIALRSGQAGAFNTAVAWTQPPAREPPASAPAPAPPPLPEWLDTGFRIEVRGLRPAWTPVAVMSDGRRTLIVFPPGLVQVEAPALFALSTDGVPELVNYRQAGDVFVVDRVLERAELRPSGAKRGAVRISRREARS